MGPYSQRQSQVEVAFNDRRINFVHPWIMDASGLRATDPQGSPRDGPDQVIKQKGLAVPDDDMTHPARHFFSPISAGSLELAYRIIRHSDTAKH